MTNHTITHRVTYLPPPSWDGGEVTFVRRYTSDATARRYAHLHLRGNQYPAGQYVLTHIAGRLVCNFYKLA